MSVTTRDLTDEELAISLMKQTKVEIVAEYIVLLKGNRSLLECISLNDKHTTDQDETIKELEKYITKCEKYMKKSNKIIKYLRKIVKELT